MRASSSITNEGNLGFQIAPMIDVVFVIMLFFMVMAGAVKVENELNTQLPGTAETSASTDFVDEQIITISDTGEVTLNDEPFDSAGEPELPQLKGTLMRLKANADAAKTPAMVTIISDDAGEIQPHDRCAGCARRREDRQRHLHRERRGIAASLGVRQIILQRGAAALHRDHVNTIAFRPSRGHPAVSLREDRLPARFHIRHRRAIHSEKMSEPVSFAPKQIRVTS